jgi:hypothetical protein
MTLSRIKSATRLATCAAALALTLLATRARADAVPPPPDDCALGSQGNTCHGGTYCTPPAPCTSDADCTGGEVCQPLAVCIGQVSCYGGVVIDGGPSTFPQASVEGLCSGGTCDDGASCTTMSLCASPTVVHSGCSCDAGAGAGGSIATAMMIMGAVLLAAQRATRQRRR